MRNSLRPETSKKLKGKKRPDVSKRFLGKIVTEETKKKMRNSRINHSMYDDPKRGEKIKNSNQKHYEQNSDRNKIISSKLIGRKAEWMKFRNKPILQYDLEGNFIKEWVNAVEAGKSLNKSSSAINECCNEKRKTAYKYVWKYKNLASKI